MNANWVQGAGGTMEEDTPAEIEDIEVGIGIGEGVRRQVPAEAEADIAEDIKEAGTNIDAEEEGKEVLHTVPDQDQNSHFLLI